MLADQANTKVAPSLAKLFLVWLGFIFCLKWQTLTEPPVWDAVWGLFPAAGELADSGFNLWSLLRKPNCVGGGPNTHSESPVTWITAGVLWLCGKGPRAFVVLHVLHFCTAAWLLAVLQRFLIPIWGRGLASVFTGTLLLCPLFRVQVGAMYFEIPLAACTLAAVVAFVGGQLGRAAMWATLGVFVKQTGLVVSGALAVAALCQPGSWRQRLARGCSFAVSGLIAAFWPLIGTPLLAELTIQSPPTSWWQYLADYDLVYLRAVPDITAVFGIVGLVGVIRFREQWRTLTEATRLPQSSANDLLTMPPRETDRSDCVNEPDRLQLANRTTSLACLLVVMFALFMYVMPYLAHLMVLGLPRYFVFLLPFVFFALTHWLTRLTSPSSAAIGLAIVALLFIGNRNGDWYPKDERDEISILERSESYRGLVAVQREAAQAAANLPDDAVIYYGFADHFFQKYPWIGYTDRTHPGGRALFLASERPKSPKPADLPDQFFVIYSNPNLFGYEAHLILRSATKDSSRQVRLYRRCQRGPFHIDIFEVAAAAKPSPIKDPQSSED